MKFFSVAAPAPAEWSAICGCAVALVLSTASTPLTGQTMKVKGGQEFKIAAGPCKPLPATAVKPAPSPQLRGAPSGSAKMPPFGSSTSALLLPAASTTWNILPNNGLEYCVNAGVVNDGAIPSGAPLTLTLNDYRSSGDASYRQEFPANLDGTTTFPPHVSAPPRTSVLTQPVLAHSAAAAPGPWCTTLTDWRRRPHLQLTLTAPGNTQPVTCFVEFQEKVWGGTPQQ